MSTPGDSVTYPPTAHTPLAHAARTSHEVVSTQPAPAATMSPSASAKGGEKPERLRGGCIPLPGGGTCFIIPCCC
ncbi:uncharacterized protein C8Q71DRAFT_282305 [Rhodofomes roseus]|uniref:Cysteine-rich transmembrane CYSTM domain-containing protein n=1 Tax=Rhodofomes roseus TaxID=34475 RepID=A0ABQ8K4B9_9APHY|nr:uncharacterized protein C8Q71DRAFT_282305 [Rhodofomes roseus]KAH9831706.1 hypothetical protein C8Q71DRAFT_282305 [Rhodofomes roseus]